MKKYYFHDGHSQQGPFTPTELKAKGISPDTPVWFEPLADWTAASQIAELKDLFTATPPPFIKSGPPEYHAPISHEANSNTSASSRKKRNLLIIAGLVLIVIVGSFIIYANGSSSPKVNLLDTSEVFIRDRKRLDSLEQIEKQRQLRDEALTKKNREYRNNWNRYIECRTNNYQVLAFGGISGLQLTVLNKTDNIIDEVIVTIRYYKADGGFWDNKDVPVYNIQPNSFETVKIENTDRGTRIEISIIKATARAIHFCYDKNIVVVPDGDSLKGVPSREASDPWFCK